MDVIIGCEESQEICKAFRKLGHNAYSCDLQDCSGGFPEWHIKDDIRNQIYKKWDLIIGHPPCTRICNSGVRWLEERDLWDELYEACEFFKLFQSLGKAGKAVAIENPIPHKYAVKYIGKYTQIIQPWMFGHLESKGTCLWLYNLPRLKPTNNVYNEMMKLPLKERQKIWWMGGGKEKIRSKTYAGIAEAMAKQWGNDNYIKPFF